MSIVDNILKEAQLNEFFGFSQKEKDAKELKFNIQKALREIDDFPFENLFRQEGVTLKRDKEIELMKNLIRSALKRAKQDMPVFAGLCPELFEFNGCGECVYDYNGKILYGVFPSMWQYAVQNQTFYPNKAKDFAVAVLTKLQTPNR